MEKSEVMKKIKAECYECSGKTIIEGNNMICTTCGGKFCHGK